MGSTPATEVHTPRGLARGGGGRGRRCRGSWHLRHGCAVPAVWLQPRSVAPGAAAPPRTSAGAALRTCAPNAPRRKHARRVFERMLGGSPRPAWPLSVPSPPSIEGEPGARPFQAALKECEGPRILSAGSATASNLAGSLRPRTRPPCIHIYQTYRCAPPGQACGAVPRTPPFVPPAGAGPRGGAACPGGSGVVPSPPYPRISRQQAGAARGARNAPLRIANGVWNTARPARRTPRAPEASGGYWGRGRGR